ncbi:hypothetical protein CN514_22740 [Bacillus sp. AFS001701]|uniref:hypothetical protein n=1 Tax=Bacillaceae TaxID=186817 RepID=UPI000BF5919B|nr:hypothetical protein [Bacillus sp. AFS001701]PET42341.1 hypothetical protein CN514_22740 [Bacillus sp. AFS001701]
MKNFKRFLSFVLLYLLYCFVGEVWFVSLYSHDSWINEWGVLATAVILIAVYTMLLLNLSLGFEKFLFFIPLLPNFIGVMLFQPIVDRYFPMLFAHDDMGVAVLVMIISIHHWIAMMSSIGLAHVLRGRKIKGEYIT